MKETLFALIGVSLLQCMLLLTVKDDRGRRILNLVGGVAMATVLLSGVTAFDFQTFAAALQREQLELQSEVDSIRENANHLHRRYIESEFAAYILERAAQMEIELSDVTVTVAWSSEGYWYPVHAELKLKNHEADLTSLQQLLESEMGIPIDEQIWRFEDESF